MKSNLKPVIIYRDELLPYSETFILNQSHSLTRYDPYFAGTIAANALEQYVQPSKLFILERYVTQPEVRKTLYKFYGIPPASWLKRLQALDSCLIHAHFGFDGLLVLPLMRYLKVPMVVTFHGYDATLGSDPKLLRPLPLHWADFVNHRGRFFRERYLRQRPQLFCKGTKFIAVSNFIQNLLLKEGCPPEKISTLYIGIDTECFAPDLSINREPIVLFVGRLVEKKGVRYLIQAMSKVQECIPDASLVLIGDGALNSSLKKLARDLNVNANFLGKQTEGTVKHWMNKSTVFCGPSVVSSNGDAEGLGMVFLEAQSMELPVVSHHSGGIPEAVADGETGILVAEGDVDALGKAIVTLMKRPDLGFRFGKAGRNRVKSRFELNTQTAKLEKIYDGLVASRLI
jgi:glycosyltransferase involved in cell wall biosynthesis